MPNNNSHPDSLLNLNKPVPAVPPKGMAVTQAVDTHNPLPYEGNTEMRDHGKPTLRPPGALAPKIPGYSGHFDESSLLDLYAEEPQKPPTGPRPQDMGHLQPSYSQPFSRYPASDSFNAASVPSFVNDDRRPSSADLHQHCGCTALTRFNNSYSP